MTVSGLAGDSDYRQWLSAGSSALPLADKQQMLVFYRGSGPKLPRQLYQETRVAFVSLVQVIQRLVDQVFAQSHCQVVAGGNLFHHVAHRRLVPRLFPPGV